jgi:hypothetical protein
MTGACSLEGQTQSNETPNDLLAQWRGAESIALPAFCLAIVFAVCAALGILDYNRYQAAEIAARLLSKTRPIQVLFRNKH